MVLHDWNDVTAARRVADEAAGRAEALLKRDHTTELTDEEMAEAVLSVAESFRLEIRALGITISHAIGEALDARR